MKTSLYCAGKDLDMYMTRNMTQAGRRSMIDTLTSLRQLAFRVEAQIREEYARNGGRTE